MDKGIVENEEHFYLDDFCRTALEARTQDREVRGERGRGQGWSGQRQEGKESSGGEY
jgi:hypothetical protein